MNKVNKNFHEQVKWKCYNCGYTWKGKNPYFRNIRPFCSCCGSWNVHVNDWLIDKEKWRKVRNGVINRDNFQCKRCGIKVSYYDARVHHISYFDYYNPNNLITLCDFCHNYKHKSYLNKIFLWLLNEDLPSSIFSTQKTLKRLLRLSILMLLFLLLLSIFYCLSKI